MPPPSGDGVLGLFCDLYELTMAAAYVDAAAERRATFDLFVRSLPRHRSYLVAAGLADALEALERFRFGESELRYLQELDRFDAAFLDRLREFRFTGSVRAIAEGELVFPEEPLLEVTAPLVEAQLVETLLLNAIGLPTLVASKAARIATVTGGRRFVDFSARRDHGRHAAIWAARAAVIGGASATSLVEAGRRYGLDLSGTMAHSYVMAFDDERDAFRCFARTFPNDAILLVDTYDTLAGTDRAIEVAHELAAEGIEVRGIRLDSGDLATLAFEARARLDAAGLRDVQIFASGDLDETRIRALVTAGAPIDAFGVGTQLGTSADAPALGVVYKLVADEAGPRIKTAAEKITLPGVKQVHRFDDHDVISLDDEAVDGGRPLLVEVMGDGVTVGAREPVAAASERRRIAVESLDPRLRLLEPEGPPYPVERSTGLAALQRRLAQEHAR